MLSLFFTLACTPPNPATPAPSLPATGPIAPGWYSLAPLPVPTQEVSVLSVDGEVWVMGGFDDALNTVDTVWIFDGELWREGPVLPRPLHHMNAALVDGRIFIVGAMEGLSFDPLPHVWSLTPGSDTWETEPELPYPVGAAATGAVGTDIFVAGGLGNGTLDQALRYDTTTGGITLLPDLPIPADHGVGTGGETFLVVGGRNNGLAAVDDTTVAWQEEDWEARAPLPTARAGAAGCLLPNGMTVVAGGEGNPNSPDGVFSEVEAYDPVTDTWVDWPAMATPRHGTGAAPFDGGVLVPGGATFQAFRAVDTVEWLVL